MINPSYSATVTIGGNSSGWTFDAFPNELNADQSFELQVTLLDEQAAAFDASGATATLFISAYADDSFAPVTLATGAISGAGSNIVDFTVPKNTIPDNLATFAASRNGSAVVYVRIDGTGFFQIYQRLNVNDQNFGLTGESGAIIPADQSVYNPDDPTDWVLVPSTVAPALDELADRVKTLEAAPAATNLSYVASPTDGTVTSSSGTDATLTLADATNAGLMAPADFTKLGGIEAGATADQSDAEIETAYNNQVGIVSQAAAEAGTSTVAERWTPERVKQAIEALSGGGGGGILPIAADSVKTGAYTVVAGDITTGATIVLGSGAAADTKFTLPVSLLTDYSAKINFRNVSTYRLQVEVSNTGTMTLNDSKTDIMIWKGDGTVTLHGDTATNANTIAGY